MINETVKKIREKAKMGQIEFSSVLDCTQSHISKVERGVLYPSHDLIVRIIRFAKKKRIKVDLNELFTE